MSAKSDAEMRARLTSLADQVSALADGDLADRIEAIVRLLPNVGITRADLYRVEQQLKAERAVEARARAAMMQHRAATGASNG